VGGVLKAVISKSDEWKNYLFDFGEMPKWNFEPKITKIIIDYKNDRAVVIKVRNEPPLQ